MHWLSLLQRASDRLLCFFGLSTRTPESVQLDNAKQREQDTVAAYEQRLADANLRLVEARLELSKNMKPSSSSSSSRNGDDSSSDGKGSIWDDLLKGLAADFDDVERPKARSSSSAASSSSSSTAANSGPSTNNAGGTSSGGKKQNTKLSPKKQQRAAAPA